MPTFSADGSSTAVKIVRSEFVSVSATGTYGGGTVTLYGKIGSCDWVELDAFTTDFAKSVLWRGQLQLVLSGSTSPSITYEIQGEQKFNHHNGK